MFRARAPIVFAAMAATLLGAASASAAPGRTVLKFDANQVNNHLQVVGIEGEELPGSDAELTAWGTTWKDGKQQRLMTPFAFHSTGQLSLNDAGVIVALAGDVTKGRTDFGSHLFRWTSPSNYRELRYVIKDQYDRDITPLPFLTDADDVLQTGDGKTFRNGALVESTYMQFADDGSVVTGFGYNDSPHAWRASLTGTSVALPSDVHVTGVNRDGHIVGWAGGATVTLVRLKVTGGKVERFDFPQFSEKSISAERAKINGEGVIVLRDGDGKFLRIRPGGKPEDITDQLKGSDESLGSLADINELGDILVRKPFSQGGTSVLLTNRTALTGQISTTAAATGRTGRASRPSLGGKTVTVNGGIVPFTAKTNAKGVFSLDVAPGSGYTLDAPGGTCVIVANGCVTSAHLGKVDEKAAKLNLRATKVTSVATYLARKGSTLKRVRGAVSTKVKCDRSNAGACKVRVTLKAGRTVYGTATTTIIKNRVKNVSVRLNRAGTIALARRSRVSVTAVMDVTIGRSKAKTTIVQAFTLAR